MAVVGGHHARIGNQVPRVPGAIRWAVSITCVGSGRDRRQGRPLELRMAINRWYQPMLLDRT